MANAIVSRTVQKGIDPRDYTLVAFGGAGPLHGAEVAAQLGIQEVIIPPHPGINSAVGLLTTDLKYDAVRTSFQQQGAVDLDRIGSDLASMEAALAGQLAADGVGQKRRSFARAADVRYAGQGYELRIPIPEGAFDAAALAHLIEGFHARHEVEYGHRFEESPVEIVNVRVTALGAMPKLGSGPPSVPDGREVPPRTGSCVFRTASGLEWLDTLFCHRDELPVGRPIAGPAVIAQLDATTVVPPGASLILDGSGNLVISLERVQ